MKKTLLWLFILLFVLSAAAGSGAELNMNHADPEGIRTIIYYVPSTNDSAVLATARFASSSIINCWADRIALWGRYNATKGLESPEKNRDIFGNKGSDDGGSGMNARMMPSDYETVPCDFWFIVPENAENTFIANETLMDQLRTLLAHPDSRLHILFIASRERIISGEDSALARLADEGKTDWTFLAPNAGNESLAADAGNVHRGSYLPAALCGRPVDLTVLQSQEEPSLYSFDVPETSTAFAVIHWNSKISQADFRITDESGNEIQPIKTFTTKDANGDLSCVLLSRTEAGTKNIRIENGEAGQIDAYWYPDLDMIRPSLEMNGKWERGDNELELRLEKMIGDPEKYTVTFSYREYADEEWIVLYPEYNAESGSWKKTISILDRKIQHVFVVPAIRMNMADGNRIWEWTGSERVSDIESSRITVKGNAPENVILYTDAAGDRTGSIICSWYDDFFNFNPSDKPFFRAETDGNTENPGIVVQTTETGLILQAKQDGEKEGTVTLECALNDENKATMDLQFTKRDISEVLGEIQFTCSQAESDKVVNAGDTVTFTVSIPAETREAWETAQRQIRDLPELQTLMLYIIPEGETEPGIKEGAPLAEKEEKIYTAEKSILLEKETEPGEKAFNAVLRVAGQQQDFASAEIRITIKNDPPVPKDQIQDTDTIPMEGFPWAWKKTENLLKACFGTEIPFDLFADDLDNLESVTVTIEPTDGLVLPDEYGDRRDGSWSFEFSNADDPAEVYVEKPGKYTIRLTASDGINASEEYRRDVQVYSRLLRYVSFAVAGIAAVLVLLALSLIIRQVRKPSFEGIRIRCFAGSDENADGQKELLEKSVPVSMSGFAKKGVSLRTLLILARQPSLPQEYADITEEILVFPTRHNDLNIQFGKNAMDTIGRHEKKELLPVGGSFRMRIGSTYILIENVQPGI